MCLARFWFKALYDLGFRASAGLPKRRHAEGIQPQSKTKGFEGHLGLGFRV